jgi:zinc protease
LDVPLERDALPNGLELALVENHTVPVVTALVAIRAGAFVETASLNGYSHLFEHMIFNGSEDVPDPIEFRRRLEALGVESNAMTGVDEVAYYFTSETAALDEAMGLFAGALRRPALIDSELEREKEVVLGEFDLDEGDYDFLRHRSMLEGLFGDYVSRVEPLGSRAVVEATTSDQLREAHDTYYVPNNALLVVSGDLDLKDARALATTHFGDWARGENPFAKNPPLRPTPLTRSRYVVLEAPVSDTRITIGWLCPGARDDRAGAMAGRLLAEVTSQSDHGFRQLAAPGLATSASFSYVPNQYASYVTVDITVPAGVEDEALRTVSSELDVVAAPGDVSPTELREAKDALWTSYFYSSDDPSTLPHLVASDWSLLDVDAYESYLDDVYAVALEDLDRFAEGCVRGRPHAVVVQSSHANLAANGIDEAYLESRL